LRPQYVHKLGGYKVQGRDIVAANSLFEDAVALQDAGADLLLLECVPASLAGKITARVDIPVIGIGAGSECDGQVLVLHDLLGVTPGKRPKFSKNFLCPPAISVADAVTKYIDEVKNGTFPDAEHAFN
jgi:3-methyl-2-oxobutanoate hydroxymethyltransferase